MCRRALQNLPGTRSGNRTRISSLRGWCTNRLYDPSKTASDSAQKRRSLQRRPVFRRPLRKSDLCQLLLASAASLHCTTQQSNPDGPPGVCISLSCGAEGSRTLVLLNFLCLSSAPGAATRNRTKISRLQIMHNDLYTIAA